MPKVKRYLPFNSLVIYVKKGIFPGIYQQGYYPFSFKFSQNSADLRVGRT